jgi:hypothetical protein
MARINLIVRGRSYIENEQFSAFISAFCGENGQIYAGQFMRYLLTQHEDMHIITTFEYVRIIFLGVVMRFRRGRAGVPESFLSVFLLAALVLIGVGVFLKQFRYNQADFAMQGASSNAAAAADKSSAMALRAPAGYTASPKTETFDADSLYEKIDGKADLYLQSGFRQLDCRVYTSGNDPNLWMEICVYDMATPRNALAVFGVQRRPEGEAIGIGDFAYQTPDAVFMEKGKYYVEITGSTVSEPLVKGMKELGAEFANGVGAGAGQIEELLLFPKEDLVPQSFKLYISGAYGYDGFKDLYGASYNVGGENVTGFICKVPDAAVADKLATDYKKFLTDNGGAPAAAANSLLKDSVFDMGGETEIVFAKGRFVAGVHGAEKQDVAETAALRILERLSK